MAKMDAIKEFLEVDRESVFCRFHAMESHAWQWTYKHQTLIAPLTNIVGVGDKTAIEASKYRKKNGALPAKFEGDLKFRLDSLTPIQQRFVEKHGSYENAGITTVPTTVREFTQSQSAIGKVFAWPSRYEDDQNV